MQAEHPLSQRSRWASGQPISYLMHKALAQPELISLAAGFVDQQSLPIAATQTATEALLSDPRAARTALQYGTTAGCEALREAVLARYLAADGTTVDESHLSIEQVVMTAGSNQLLHLVSETLLDPGDVVLCGAPGYFVFFGIVRGLGAVPMGVATDSSGMIPEALDEQLAALDQSGELSRVKAVYLTSYFDNPSTVTLPVDRRAAIVDIAKRWSTSSSSQIYIIEDAAYRDLRYSGDDVPSMRSFDSDGSTVIVTETFSKCYSPGIRVGHGFLPTDLVGPVCEQKGNIDFGSPNFNQHIMAKVMELGLLEPHIEQLKARYRTKLDAMLKAADEFLTPLGGIRWHRPSGGIYLWAEFPAEIDTGPKGKLFDLTIAEGAMYVPGEYCFPDQAEGPRTNLLRLSFGVQTPDKIRHGMEALARAIRQVMTS